MKVVGCGGLDRPSGLAAAGTLPNPEAHGDSKMTLSSGPPLRLFPLKKPRTDGAIASSKTKPIGKNAWATVREKLPAIAISQPRAKRVAL